MARRPRRSRVRRPLPLPGDGAARRLPAGWRCTRRLPLAGTLIVPAGVAPTISSARPVGGTDVTLDRRARGRSAARAWRPHARVDRRDRGAQPHPSASSRRRGRLQRDAVQQDHAPDVRPRARERPPAAADAGSRSRGRTASTSCRRCSSTTCSSTTQLVVARHPGAARVGLGSQAGARRPGGDAARVSAGPARTLAAVTRRFYVRTYGCQMNEHDSERIAGLLAADGMEPTDDLEAADVVVLNTCCIRENADNKLYGHLGRLKALKARAARPADRGRRLPRPEGPRAHRASGAGHVDVVFGTHNLAHAPALLARARTEGPIVEILEEHEAYPSALPARRDVDHSAWVTIQIGCDNSCAFCIVPIVRGAEVSRRMGDIVHEVEELAADGVRRDHAARPERQLVRPRPRRRAVPPAVRRPAARARRGRRHRAHPLHVAAPEGPAARDDRGDGRVRARVRAPAPAAAVGQRPHARAHAPRLHRRALPRAARRRRAPRSPTSRSPPTSSSASPARPTPTSRARSRSSTPPRTTPRTRSCSRPGPAPRPPTMTDDFVPAEVAQERMQRLAEVVERHALAQARGARRARSRRCSSRARRRRTRRCGRAAPARTSSCTSRRASSARRRRRLVDVRDHARRAALAARRRSSRRSRPRAARVAHPASPSRLRRRVTHLALVGPTASGKSALALGVARALGDVEIVSLDSMQVYRGHGHRHRQADAPPSGPRSPHHLSTSPIPSEEWSVARSQAAARAAIADIEARGRRALLVGGTGLYVRAVVDDLALPGRGPRACAPRSTRATATADGLAARLRRARSASTRSPRRGSSPATARRIVRALEVIELTGRPFSSFGPGLDDVRPARVPGRASSASGSPRAVLGDAHRGPLRRDARRRAWSTRSAASRPARRAVRAPRARRSATGRCSAHLDGERAVARRRARRRPVRRTRRVRPPPAHVVPARPPHHVARRRRRIPCDARCPRCWQAGVGAMTARLRLVQAPRHRQRLPRAARARRGRARRSTRAVAVALCDRHRGIGADGLITLGPGTDGADCTMTLRQRRRRRRRDERQRHPLPRVGRGPRRPRRRGNGSSSTPAAAGARSTLDARRATATSSRPTSTWARSRSIPRAIPLDAPIAVRPRGRRSTASTYRGDAAGIGNPHLVLFVDDPAAARVTQHGPRLEHDARFPQPHQRRVRRASTARRPARACGSGSAASGETLSCGTGACAVGRGRAPPRPRRRRACTVDVPGGDARRSTLGATVRLGGPVVHVFDVDVPIEALRVCS